MKQGRTEKVVFAKLSTEKVELNANYMQIGRYLEAIRQGNFLKIL